MIYNNSDKNALYARDMELWYSDEKILDDKPKKCERCGKILSEGYYDINNYELCEKCAKLEFKEHFEELEDLEKLKQTCEYDSIEQLIEDTIDEELYKYLKIIF